MADIRIKDLATTASTTASDDFLAVDGTTNGTRKLSAATPSFATSVTVPGVVGPTSTDLTLTGGTSGASLVLGATTSGVATLTGLGGITLATPVGAVTTIQRTGLNGVGAAGVLSITTDAKTANDAIQLSFAALDSANNAQAYSTIRSVITDPTSTSEDADLVFLSARAGTITEAARLVSTGNVLIGTTTDMTGSGGLKIAGTTAATSTTSGALIVAGGVGVSGAGYFGGALNAPSLTGAASTDLALNGGSGTSNVVLTASGAGGNVYARPGASGYVRVDTGLGMRVESGTLNVTTTTSASSSIVGALTIGNGTAATNVAIGGGNVNAGGAGTFGGVTSASLGSLNANSSDPSLRFTASAGVADSKVYEIRNIGATNNTFLQFRTWDDALTTATTRAQFWRSGGVRVGATILDPGAYNVVIEGTSASTSSTSGALQVAGGIYAGAASVFGGAVEAGSLNLRPLSNSPFTNSAWIRNTTNDGVFFANSDASKYAGLKTDGTFATNGNLLAAAATFTGAVSVGNTVAVAAAVASTHKVTMVIGGVTYYLLATNV